MPPICFNQSFPQNVPHLISSSTGQLRNEVESPCDGNQGPEEGPRPPTPTCSSGSPWGLPVTTGEPVTLQSAVSCLPISQTDGWRGLGSDRTSEPRDAHGCVGSRHLPGTPFLRPCQKLPRSAPEPQVQGKVLKSKASLSSRQPQEITKTVGPLPQGP